MSKKENNDGVVTLESGRKVEINEMSIDDVDFCNDVTTVFYNEDGSTTIKGMSKARTTWLRRGIKGGDFDNFSMDGKFVSDSVIRQLNAEEKNELMQEIQAYQELGD